MATAEAALPQNILGLSQKNEGRVQALCKLMRVSEEDMAKDWEVSREAGIRFMQESFPAARFRYFIEGAIDRLEDVLGPIANLNQFYVSALADFRTFQDLTDIWTKDGGEVLSKRDLAQKIFNVNIAMLVIRPEMVHMTQQIKEFLERLGFGIWEIEEVFIDMDTYWTLYKDAIVNPQAFPSMPTRTMVYTNSPAK